MSLRGQERLDRLVHDGRERDNVSQRNEWRGLNTIRIVLLHTGMSQGDFVLIVQPVLIVRTEAGIENPLLKA